MLGSSMRFISILAFTWTINKCSYTIHNCCNNQDHKKKYHAQEEKKYRWKPFSTREENSTILCYILKTNTSHTIDLEHKRVLSKTKKLVPKRGAHFNPKLCTFWNFQNHMYVVCFLNGKITFIYTRLNTSKVVSIGTTWLTSITHNIINNYHINYLLLYGGPTCTLYITNRVTGKSDSWKI